MQKLHIVALAMLFTMTGTSLVQAKSNQSNQCQYTSKQACKSHKASCHWNKGTCRKGMDSKLKVAKNQTVVVPEAPQSFKPAGLFSDHYSHYSGSYFSKMRTANITDSASTENPTSYPFENVTIGGTTPPAGSILIGTMPQSQNCSDTATCPILNVYGKLFTGVPSTLKQIAVSPFDQPGFVGTYSSDAKTVEICNQAGKVVAKFKDVITFNSAIDHDAKFPEELTCIGNFPQYISNEDGDIQQTWGFFFGTPA